MVGRVGIEPTTVSLKGCCSATELPTHDGSKIPGNHLIGNMEDIASVVWFDGKGVRPMGPGDAGKAFKWILAERKGPPFLIAMPGDTDLDFHKELRDAVCASEGWEPEDLKVSGGGVRLKDGSIIHRSTYFGPMPEAYREPALRVLGLGE